MSVKLLKLSSCAAAAVGALSVFALEQKKSRSSLPLPFLNAQDVAFNPEHTKSVENERLLTINLSSLSSEVIPSTNSKCSLDDTIQQASDVLSSLVVEKALPGLVVGVSVDGKTVATFSLGFSDVENMTPCKPSTTMRIASISKSITMAAAAELIDQGKLNLDKNVREYVAEWPEKHPEITVRQLVSHLSGIRHYSKKSEIGEGQDTSSSLPKSPLKPGVCMKCSRENEVTSVEKEKARSLADGSNDSEFKEFLLNKKFQSISEALEIFKNDELLSKPGEEFNYTTHGFTLLSAVIENVVSEPFDKYIGKFFKKLGLKNTFLDENEPIIKHRSRYYMRSKNHGLINAQNVDNSYKWAGGGFLSTVSDLLYFGNAMLYSYQFPKVPCLDENNNATNLMKPFLHPDTVMEMWSPIVPMYKLSSLHNERHYGMGWTVVPPCSNFAHCRADRFVVSHSGGAVGASSMLLILPSRPSRGHFGADTSEFIKKTPPNGVVVSMITNLGNVSLYQAAYKLAEIFESTPLQPLEKDESNQ